MTKSKRLTDMFGAVVSTIELDPWGADTARSNNAAFQPKKFTSYDRDGNGSDEAMFRRSNRWHSRFDQPDPSDGSYSLANPQSFNRYAYVQGDPVNLVDPSGLLIVAVLGRFCVDTGDGHPSCTTEVVGYYDIPDGFSGFFGGGYGGGSGGDPASGSGGGGGGGGQQGPAPGFDKALGEPPSWEYLLLSLQDCGNFIAELMSIAESLSTSDRTPSFAPMLGPGGPEPSYTQYYGMDEYERAVRDGRVTASGISGRVGDITTYGTTEGYSTIKWNKEYYALSREDAARQRIHESLHLIYGFGDFELAGAAHIMATRSSSNPGNSGNFANQSAASIYLNEQIARHCGCGG